MVINLQFLVFLLVYFTAEVEIEVITNEPELSTNRKTPMFTILTTGNLTLIL